MLCSTHSKHTLLSWYHIFISWQHTCKYVCVCNLLSHLLLFSTQYCPFCNTDCLQYIILSLNEPSSTLQTLNISFSFGPKSQLIQLQTTTSVTQLRRLFKMRPRGFFRSWECVLLVPHTLRGRTQWLTWTWKLRSRSVTEPPLETAARGCGGRPPAQRTQPEPSDWTAPPEETRLPAHHGETRRKAQEMPSWRDWYWDRGWGL